MDATLLAATLRAYQQRSPFHPYTIVLGSGTRLECDFPNAINYRDRVGVHLGPGGIPAIFDAAAVDHVLGNLSEAEIDRERSSAA